MASNLSSEEEKIFRKKCTNVSSGNGKFVATKPKWYKPGKLQFLYMTFMLLTFTLLLYT